MDHACRGSKAAGDWHTRSLILRGVEMQHVPRHRRIRTAVVDDNDLDTISAGLGVSPLRMDLQFVEQPDEHDSDAWPYFTGIDNLISRREGR